MVAGALRNCLPVAIGMMLALLGAAPAQAAGPQRTVSYRGYTVKVPASWPVYHLARHPSLCVRFDRPAVYLGRPGSRQRCPARAAGRRQAVLIEPGVGVRHAPRLRGAPSASSMGLANPAAVFTGRGFDACSAPSPTVMADWLKSPYRAVGIYIGGVNAACAQPNLSAGWVQAEVAAGWRLIPTYVGLQAPGNSCGCTAIIPSQAAAQGTAAAADAVAAAGRLGIGPGAPIYYDMEAYTRSSTNTGAVLGFLAAWTAGLHAAGYRSGVYSSVDSGIADLVGAWGSGFTEPDDIWMAVWDGQQSTTSPLVPGSEWSDHQRLHQYTGGHNETYGGATLNIDADYLDGATVGSGPAPPPLTAPTVTVAPAAGGTTTLVVRWRGAPVASWMVLAGDTPTGLSALTEAPGGQSTIRLQTDAGYFQVQAFSDSGQLLASSAVAAAPAHLAIFGHGAFVGAGNGIGRLPFGCYSAEPCRVSVRMTAGRTMVAAAAATDLASGPGTVSFKLTRRGRQLLTRARGGLAVVVRARSTNGPSTSASLTLHLFSTHGPGPATAVTSSATLQIAGTSAFVSRRGVGGVLAACYGAATCRAVVTSVYLGRRLLAGTGPELIGGDELGYLTFRLGPAGRALLARAAGNHLGVRVVVANAGATAGGNIELVGFH